MVVLLMVVTVVKDGHGAVMAGEVEEALFQ
jgi:hypothetical protein